MTYDKDLQSIQEVRGLIEKAKAAQLDFRQFPQSNVDRIVAAMAKAGEEAAERLGILACEETGFGKPEDKKLKNIFGTKYTYESIKDLRTVGIIREDHEKRIIEIAEPMGVVAALIPSTNPTSTVMFKALIAVKGRNALVASPHPRAVRCTAEAVRILQEAAEREGAPAGLISCMETVTIEGTNELMHHKLTDVILATGSTPMVRAAYSAGKPAYGVGSGNVPAFIERTANVRKAVADILSGKTFDNGTLCSTESALICDAPLRDAVMMECKTRGGYFVTGADKGKLERMMFDPRGAINPDMVGKPATYIAHHAGIEVPQDTKVLIAECTTVGREEPLSREKLSPVLSFYIEDGWLAGCHRCIELLNFGGIGHTMVIHSEDRDIIMKFALEKPAFRVLVNTQAALGAVGYTTGLDPSMTLGPGTMGGSIVSDNITARHLINIKRLAYETRPFLAEFETTKSKFPRTEKSAEGEQRTDWIKQIEERLLQRAGNIPIAEQRPKPAPENGEKEKTFGTGISEHEISRIIEEFARKYR
jgi:acetaldehyde dehydrogenase (acetylating)